MMGSVGRLGVKAPCRCNALFDGSGSWGKRVRYVVMVLLFGIGDRSMEG